MRAYDSRYVWNGLKNGSFFFRLRIFLAERLIPKRLNNYGREQIIGYISKGGTDTHRKTHNE